MICAFKTRKFHVAFPPTRVRKEETVYCHSNTPLFISTVQHMCVGPCGSWSCRPVLMMCWFSCNFPLLTPPPTVRRGWQCVVLAHHVFPVFQSSPVTPVNEYRGQSQMQSVSMFTLVSTKTWTAFQFLNILYFPFMILFFPPVELLIGRTLGVDSGEADRYLTVIGRAHTG